ncbi:hypothetical protein JMUB6875_74220 [Nocardia sp. JMUB6875]
MLCVLPAVLVALIASLPLVVALPRHPECASIPDSVGPCDFWGRLTWLIGPLVWVEVVFWLAALGLVVAVVYRRRSKVRSSIDV